MIDEITDMNVAVYDSLATSFEAGRKVYLPVMRREMSTFLGRLRRMEKKVSRNLNILDVGSGAGIHAQILTESGFGVTCIDASRSMLDVVRRNVPSARCIRTDFWDHESCHNYDAVILASFIHLFPKEKFYDIIHQVRGWINPGALGWIATVTGPPHNGMWIEKESNHGFTKRWRVVYSDSEIREYLKMYDIELLETVHKPDGMHKEKMWTDYIIRF